MSLLLTNATLATLGETNQVIPDGAVLVQDGVVRDVGTTAQVTARHPGVAAQNLGGKLLMPGCINAHTHLYSTFARGMGLKDPPPGNFLEILERVWWRLDKALTQEDVYYSALIPLMECLKRGTTTLIDHHASPHAVDGSLDQIAKAAREVGVRVATCYEVSDRDGAAIAAQGIAENVRFAKQCAANPDPMVAPAFGLHASFTLSRDTLHQVGEALIGHTLPLHIHIAEDLSDVEQTRAMDGGSPPLERLAHMGFLQQPTLAAHCIHLSEREKELLDEETVWPIHNAQSNMNNAVGWARVGDYLAKGVRVAMGTDGFTVDMLAEMRTVPLLHRAMSGNPQACGFGDLYRMLFVHNPKLAALFFKQPLGVIAAGAAADMVVLDYRPPTPLSTDNFMGHLYFGMGTARVDTVFVGGQVRLQDGRVPHLDEERIYARSRELAARLWERF
ncbi:MAG: putative aminohydrolase SsnA [Candidatus Xenobia bacterium]